MIEIFEQYIENQIGNMQGDYVELISGDIHRELGGYPSNRHYMPSCCCAMRKYKLNDDMIIYEPPKGNGTTLKIRYYKKNHTREVLKCHNT